VNSQRADGESIFFRRVRIDKTEILNLVSLGLAAVSNPAHLGQLYNFRTRNWRVEGTASFCSKKCSKIEQMLVKLKPKH